MQSQAALIDTDCPPETEGVAELSARLAEELSHAVAIAGDCQEALGEALGHDVRRDLAERLQRMDELTQRLADLANVLERLSAGADLGCAPLDVFDGLKLSDMRSRLSGARHAAAVSGDAELW